MWASHICFYLASLLLFLILHLTFLFSHTDWRHTNKSVVIQEVHTHTCYGFMLMFAYECQHITFSYIPIALHVVVVGVYNLLVKIHKAGAHLWEYCKGPIKKSPYCEDLANSQKVYSFTHSVCVLDSGHQIFPDSKFFGNTKSLVLFTLIFEYKLSKEDFRHWTTLFKSLLMSRCVLHDVQCNPCRCVVVLHELTPASVHFLWSSPEFWNQLLFLFVYGAVIAHDLLWQNLGEDSVSERLGPLLTSRIPNEQLCILNQSKFPNGQLPLLLPLL